MPNLAHNIFSIECTTNKNINRETVDNVFQYFNSFLDNYS